MSQILISIPGGGAGSIVESLTSNSGGAVFPTGNNINVLGSGILSGTGNPGTSTITFAITNPVPIANGGTNATSMTNTNGVSYFDGTRLVTTTVGTAAQILTSNGAGVAPTFQNAPAGGITTLAGDTGSATGSTVTIAGGTNINTSGTAATLTVNLDDAVNLPTSTGTTVGTYLINSVPMLQSRGTTSIFLGNSGNYTNTGTANVGIGSSALANLSTSEGNVCIGVQSGQSISNSGGRNVSVGFSSMVFANQNSNVCIGGYSGYQLTGASNTLIGDLAMWNATGGAASNIMIGSGVGGNYTGAESSNIIIGNAGVNGESNAIRIGTSGSGSGQQNATYIVGIQGVTVTGTPVLVSATDQLGIAVSSARFKDDIKDMEGTERIHSLRPVNFTYKADDIKATQWGLIAEEVEEVFPELVGYDSDKKPFLVKYLDLIPILLKEVQELRKELSMIQEVLNG